MLEIRDLYANAGDKEILKGLSLEVKAGEVHAIMGPNGSGKSTLAHVLAGRETCTATRGEVIYQGMNLLEMPPEERAREGLFLAFQYPVEIPGVSNLYFLKAALNAIRKRARAADPARQVADDVLEGKADEVESGWEDQWARQIFTRALEEARRRFDEQTFEAFELYAHRGVDVEEVADRLGMSPNGVHQAKSRVLRVLRAVADRLRADEG